MSDEIVARFDGAAADAGGRSALLRRLVTEAGQGARPGPAAARGPRSTAQLKVRLGPAEAAHVEAAAAAMGLRRASWVAALVRRHVLGRPTFDPAQEDALLAIRAELRRIAVNVNQIARDMNTAVMEGRGLETDLVWIDDLKRELAAHMVGLREAFEGNLAYWEVAS